MSIESLLGVGAGVLELPDQRAWRPGWTALRLKWAEGRGKPG